MEEGAEPMFVQRVLGSAIVSGASAASVALALGRPMVRDGLRSACERSTSMRKSAAVAARDLGGAAWESARPFTGTALHAKDRARRRAVGMLPPEVGAVVEAWRHDFIEAEKSVYYGSRGAMAELEPRLDQACTAGLELALSAVDVLGDIADATLAAAVKVGDDMQRPRQVASAPKKRTRPKPKGRR